MTAFYSKTTNGIYESESYDDTAPTLGLVPADAMLIADDLYTTLLDGVQSGSTLTLVDGIPTLSAAVVNLVPQVLTAYQAKAALSQAGLYAAVNTYMTTTAPELEQIAWANASSFDRSDTFIASLAPALNLTGAQIDQLFIVGATLTA